MIITQKLQRMIKSTDIGFTYDYATHGLHATANGKKAFAKAFVHGKLKAKLVDFVEQYNNNEFHTDAIIMSTPEVLNMISDQVLFKAREESIWMIDPEIVAWMSVSDNDDRLVPIFIVRASVEDAQERINKLFDGFIEDYRESLNGA